MRALFNEGEFVRGAKVVAHFEQLSGEEFAEDGTDADAGEKVAALAGAWFFRGVITVVRMVERDGHELVEADGTLLRDAAAEFGRGSVRAG